MLNDANTESFWDNVELLLPFNNNFVDVKNSYGPSTIVGSPFITRLPTKFQYGTGAVQFNGNTDGLRYQHTTDTSIGIDDFTIEFWFSADRFGSMNGGAYNATTRGIFTNNTIYSTELDQKNITVKLVNNNLIFEVTGVLTTVAYPLLESQWTHVAISRTDTTMYFFINGELYHTLENADYNFSTNTFVLGYSVFTTNVANAGYFAGQIDDFRFTKGVGRYTESFIEPYQAYTAGNTVILPLTYFPSLQIRGAEGVVDISEYNRNLNNGIRTPSVSSNVPFIDGSSSLRFSGSFLSTFSNNTNYRLGTDNFTLESWIYPTSNNGTIMSSYGYPQRKHFWMGLVTGRLRIKFGDGGNINQALNSDYFYISTTAHDIPLNKWSHVAWSRSGSTNRVFINGVLVTSFTNLTNWGGNVITIGMSALLARYYWSANLSSGYKPYYLEQNSYSGYMNDIKVSRLVCKYTSNFNPYDYYLRNRPQDLSDFERSEVKISDFEPVTLFKVSTPAPSNNIFWYNNDSGFHLRKATNLATGVIINTAQLINGNLSFTLSNNSNVSVGNVIPDYDISELVTNTGVLESNSSSNVNFKPVTASSDVSISEVNGSYVLSSNIAPALAQSFDNAVFFANTVERTLSDIPVTHSPNIWNTRPVNTIGYNKVNARLVNNRMVLPAGTYSSEGYLHVYQGNRVKVRLQDVTNNIELLGFNVFSKISTGGTATPLVLLDGTFTLFEESEIELQIYATANITAIQTQAASTVTQSFNITFFRIG
jgi:hypothetical protein